MKNIYKAAISTTLAAACVVMVFAQTPAPSQDEKAKAKAAAKAKAIAQAFELNARMLTVFDRDGKQVSIIGPRGMYATATLSPDNKRVALVKADLDKEVQDVFILDAATGNSTQLTFGQWRETAVNPVWSPDGKYVAYVAVRGGNYGVYQITTDGKGKEELLYALPGIANTTDWSMDGRYISFYSTDLGGGTLYALAMDSPAPRKPIEVFHSAKQLFGSRLSPDDRFIAYASNESGRNEIYVRPFDASAAGTAAGPWKISDQGGQGMAFWRKDGKELFYLAADRGIMSVNVSTAPMFEFGKPKLLFRLGEAVPIVPNSSNVSRDGQNFLIAVPPPALRQITVFDRQGKVVQTVGEPGLYNQANFSPDASKIVCMRNDLKTGNLDIWTYDVATGKGYQVTDDTYPDNAPIWSPDGKSVLYVSTRDSYSGIYRKAWDGTGNEELLFRYTPGAGIMLTDSTSDGRFLTFSTGVLVMVSLAGNDALARPPIDWLRDEFDNIGARFSPDMKYVAYLADKNDPMMLDIYVRPFDPSKKDAEQTGAAVEVTKDGVASGLVNWRRDGKELFYLTRDWEMMAMDVTATPEFHAGSAKLLFKLPGPAMGNPFQWKNVSPDGQRFVFTMPVR